MPGIQPNAIRGNQVYMGWAKQTEWGAPLAPASYWRWLTGSRANPLVRLQTWREGDASAFESFAVKRGQWWVARVVEYLRPISAGAAIQALLGSGSDAFTAPATGTTLAAGIVPGATTFQTAASVGATGTGWLAFTPGYASASNEALNVNFASRTGSGPYTYALVAGQQFLMAHASGDPVASASMHVFTRQYAYDPYAIEIGYGAGGITPNAAFRLRDCVCYDLELEAVAGRPARLTHLWYGISGKTQATPATPTFEGAGSLGTAGRPLLMADAGNTWKLNNAATGNAATIARLRLKLHNTARPDAIRDELLAPSYFLPGNIEITGSMEVHFATFQEYSQAYYSSASPPAGSTDGYSIGYESLNVTFAADGINGLTLALPTIAYAAAELAPQTNGDVLRQPIMFRALRSPANPSPITLTLTNTQNTPY